MGRQKRAVSGAAPDDTAQIHVDHRTPNGSCARRSSSDPDGLCNVKSGLHQTIELRFIWIMGRQIGAAPHDKAQIHDYGTPHGGCARRYSSDLYVSRDCKRGLCKRRSNRGEATEEKQQRRCSRGVSRKEGRKEEGTSKG